MTPQCKCIRQEQSDPWEDSGIRARSIPCINWATSPDLTLLHSLLCHFQSIWFLLLPPRLSIFCFFSGFQAQSCKERKEGKQECALIIQILNSQRKDWLVPLGSSIHHQPNHPSSWVWGKPGHVKHSYRQGPYDNRDRRNAWQKTITCS